MPVIASEAESNRGLVGATLRRTPSPNRNAGVSTGASHSSDIAASSRVTGSPIEIMSGSQGQRRSRIARWIATLFSTTRVRRSGSRDFDIEIGQYYKCQRPNQVGDESAISDRTLLRDETRQMGLTLVVTLLD